MGLAMPNALPGDVRIGAGPDIGEMDDVAPTQGMCSSSGHSRMDNRQLFLFTYELEMLSKKSEKKTQSRGRAGAHTEGDSRRSGGEGGEVLCSSFRRNDNGYEFMLWAGLCPAGNRATDRLSESFPPWLTSDTLTVRGVDLRNITIP